MLTSKMAKFCANLGFLFTENNSTIAERFRLAKKAGFRAIETPLPTDVNFDDVIQAYKETQLEVILLNIYTGTQNFGCAALPNKVDEFKENFSKTVKLAKALNCKKIHVMAGQLSNDATSENHETYLNNMKYAASVLAPENITAVIEPICSYGVPRYYLNNVDNAVEIIKCINSPNVKLLFDFYHMQHLVGNLTNNLKELMPIIGHVQIAQVPYRNEPNTEGELNYKYLFKNLKELGYSDWMGCEYKPKVNSNEGLNWVKSFDF